MELLTKFPVMERSALAELRKGIDFAFRDFSRAYGDAIEAFFDPLLFFLVWLEKLLIEAPWPITIAVICGLAWLGSRNWKLVVGSCSFILSHWLLWYVERLHGNSSNYYGLRNYMHVSWYSCGCDDGKVRKG